MANDEMLRQPAEPTAAIAAWEQEQQAKRQRAVETMVFQELQRRGQDGDHVSIAKALLEDPRGEVGSNFAKFMDQADAPMGGWMPEDVANLGRNPESRELSIEGRRRDMHLRNRQLLHALWNAPAENRDVHQNLAANAWLKEQGRTHGTSGWTGAFNNPEYLAGWAGLGSNAFADAPWMQYSGQNPPSKAEQAASLGSAGLAVSLGATNRIVGAARNYLTKHLPDAKDLFDAKAAAHKVDPILPAGMTREQGHQFLERLATADGPNYDELYRLNHGEYPSYANSTAAVLFSGLMDPTLLTPGVAAKAATATGVGLMKAGAGGLGKAGARSLAGRAAYGYGKSVAKAAAPMGRQAVLGAALNEGIEEAPLNAGIMAMFANALPRSLVEAFTPGNTLRRDMYQPVYGQDGKPILDENRNPITQEESQDDFLRRMYDNPDLEIVTDPKTKMRVAAPNAVHGPKSKLNAPQIRREIPAGMNQIKQSLIRR